MPTQPLIYTIEASLSLKASFYQTKNPHPKNATLLYLHGGGFFLAVVTICPKRIWIFFWKMASMSWPLIILLHRKHR